MLTIPGAEIANAATMEARIAVLNRDKRTGACKPLFTIDSLSKKADSEKPIT